MTIEILPRNPTPRKTGRKPLSDTPEKTKEALRLYQAIDPDTGLLRSTTKVAVMIGRSPQFVLNVVRAAGIVRPRASYMRPIEQRFWRNVDKNGPVPPHLPELGPCWVWKSQAEKGGYGRLGLGGRGRGGIQAHVFSWTLAYGSTMGLCVCHRCDSPSCVNPAHLFLGTLADNNADMRQKGRGSNPPRKSGEKANGSKLTTIEVTEIRELISRGVSHRTIAGRYGVARTTITAINLGVNWKD